MTQAKRPQQGNVPGKIWSDLLTAKRCGHGFDPKIIVKKYVFRSKQQRCVREWSTTMDTRYISLLFVVCHLHAICNTLNYGTRGLLFANQSQKSHQNWCQIIKVQSKSENSRQKKQTRKPLEQLLFQLLWPKTRTRWSRLLKVEFIVNQLGKNVSADLFCGVFVGGDCGDTGTINDWTVKSNFIFLSDPSPIIGNLVTN